MDNIDAELNHLLGEINQLSQSLADATNPPEVDPALQRENTFTIGFTDLKESLNALDYHDLDSLESDLGSELTPQHLSNDRLNSSVTHDRTAPPAATRGSEAAASPSLPQIVAGPAGTLQKLIIKIMMSDGSSKTLMVDERQTVREVLDILFEKTHCDCSIEWSLCETNPELLIERIFEDHEHLVDLLSSWSCHSENKIYFVTRPQKYVMFTDPQIFYMWKRKSVLSETNECTKKLLLKEHFEGPTLIVPNIEGILYLKEDGKKVWKPRYFILRASGIYYVPKGKKKSSSDLAFFLHFDQINVHTTDNYKQKYRAPTNYCFMLKHPSIQNESDYIKCLCCEDEHSLLLWVNSIRIAKHGAVLYQNYQAAVATQCDAQEARSKNHDTGISAQPDPAPAKILRVEDSVEEPPPDFIPPPPPPGHTHM